MLVLHQSKCITAIKCMLFYYRHIYIIQLIHIFVYSLLLRCMPSRVACGSEDAIHNRVLRRTGYSLRVAGSRTCGTGAGRASLVQRNDLRMTGKIRG